MLETNLMLYEMRLPKILLCALDDSDVTWNPAVEHLYSVWNMMNPD